MSSISKADSDEKIGEFWDTHDFTEFDTDARDAEFEVISTVPVQLKLLNEIEAQAAESFRLAKSLPEERHRQTKKRRRGLSAT